MIIGISGKKQHGKNTVADIIEYLTDEYRQYGKIVNPYDELMYKGYKRPLYVPHWSQRLFADKLKDIVCLLINCTREQLEDNTFKEKELGEEWWYYKEFGNYIIIPYLSDFINNGRERVESIGRVKLIKPTPRLLLQLMGTECGRQIIHPNVWVNALMSEYKEKFSGNPLIKKDIKDNSKWNYPNWVITDVRFPNEVKAIEGKEGFVLRVVNPRVKSTDNHESETALDNHSWRRSEYFFINNDGSIEELIEKVRKVLIKEKILK